MKTNEDKFLQLYKKLEVFAQHRYSKTEDDNTGMYNLAKDAEFKEIKSEIQMFINVRNVLSHRTSNDEDYVISVSDKLVQIINNVVRRIVKPNLAKDVCVPIEKTYVKTLNDEILPIMKEMNKQVYTSVPILEDGVVCGVFSENTILSYLVDETIIEVEEGTKVSDLKKYLPIKAHNAETYKFVSEADRLSDIKDYFKIQLNDKKRVAMLFVTQTGKSKEPLKGIITAWDMAPIADIW